MTAGVFVSVCVCACVCEIAKPKSVCRTRERNSEKEKESARARARVCTTCVHDDARAGQFSTRFLFGFNPAVDARDVRLHVAIS